MGTMNARLFFCFALVLNRGFCSVDCEAASGMFPKMPPATNTYVVNINQDSGDAWMTAWALQGLVNQQSAEVYLINNRWDWDPLKSCGKPYEELPRLPGADAGLRTLFQKYQGQVKKIFIYDPDKDWTWYLALMSGAQQEGIPVTESIKDELISEFDWKGDVIDFRYRWANRIQAYDWALANLMPRCTKKVVFATGNRRDKYRERIGNPITDYVVASKGFVFWLDFDTEQAEVQKIFSTPGYGVGTSLMGYCSTGDGGNIVANPFGIGYVVSELYANGSFWSSFPDKTYTQPLGKAIKAEPGKIYAHIIWSDGDNLEFDQNPLYKFWHDPARGTVPVATELAPALQELNSPLLDWYYSKMTTNDELVAGPTGFQYIFIGDFNDTLFPEWCYLNRIWCAGAGFHATRIWMAPNPSPKYSEYTTMSGLDGLFGEGWRIKAGYPPKIDTFGANNEEDLFNEITKIKPDSSKPIFCGFTCIVGGFYQGDHGYSAIKRVVDRVETAYPGRYVFLLPKDEFATIRTYYNTDMQQVIGLPDSDRGLTPTYCFDGQFKIVNRDGKQYWLAIKNTSSHYFYLKVPDQFRPEPGKMLEIDLSYLDTGSGDIGLDYDSTDIQAPLGGAYKRYPYTVHRMNSGQWKLAQFYVNDAGFGGSENNFSDFRFDNEGDDLLIRAIDVRRVNR
jgi:GxGYxY sequence motif in domain of unknown function N-terminal/GxGYxYP putative glycoside hydrolase C-terminal domain